MTKFLLITSDEAWLARVKHAFEYEIDAEVLLLDEESLDTTVVMRKLYDADPPVLVVGPGYESTAAPLALARAVDERRPDISVILVAESSPTLLQEAVRAGVRDVIDTGASDDIVRGSLALALEMSLRRRAALRSIDGAEGASRVLTVISPKGGSGKTAMATNTAIGLARLAPNEVVIVDLDLQFGDVTNALRLAPERTMADVARKGSDLDATSVKAFLTPHPSGLFALAAPDSPAEADLVTPEILATTLDLLASEFRYVVVDTGAGLDEPTLLAAEHSTDLVLVCATDVASARGLRKGVEALDMLGLTTQRRHFVLNRADARVGITIQDIEQTVGLDVAVTVCSNRVVPTSMNQGSPLLETDPRSTAAKGFNALVRRIVPSSEFTQSQPAEAKTPLLRRMKGAR
jgi:pilus assembly protein CpaE